MKLLAFATSNSRSSINKQLVTYAASLLEGVDVEILDLNDYELPLFSVDRERELGQPELAKQFLQKIADADALLISFAEHNMSFTAAWKNLYDWCSRIETKVYQGKPTVLLSTSPGGRGGANALEAALKSAPRFGADIRGSLSLPSFNDNFDTEAGVVSNPELDTQLKEVVASLK
ncbi:MAG: NAD(P)H-dependent oxidoreductase [Pseudomonadales bacterium]|nr:NAD(P)H-dependent oxidoreductase [Pseudomonadales bacterium]